MPPLTKKYLEFCFSNSLEQIITAPTTTTDRTVILTDHVLTNSSHQVRQSGLIHLSLSDHNLIFCTRKTLPEKTPYLDTFHAVPKSRRHNEILVRSIKYYTTENFKETLKKIVFQST